VHFSKDTPRKFHCDDVEMQTFLKRGVPDSIRPRAGRLPLKR
jgi:hypothetical protein